MQIDAILILAVEIFVVFNIIMGLSSVCTWIERKGSALIQDRIGANRAGAFVTSEDILSNARMLCPALPAWLLRALNLPLRLFVVPPLRALGALGVINTLLCDAVKALTKEDFIPQGISNFVHCLGPFLAVFPVFLAFAVIPLAPEFELMGMLIRPQVAELGAGVLFILAMGSVSVYGVAFAGWTGNNKFSLLGGLRASAQMISYELAMGISMVSVVLVYGSLDLYEIIEAQQGLWGVFLQPLAFIILFVVGMAETKRGPFDLPEAESELVAGYFTEYSGMKFLLFWLGEFAEIALFALLMTILFFGGWHAPFVQTGVIWLAGQVGFEVSQGHWVLALVGHLVLMGKVLTLCVLQIVIRWTLPRFRYDTLMSLGWKVLLPLSLLNLMVTAALKIAF